MKEKDKIILVGDIHGEYSRLRYNINRLNHEDAYIIQVGDFGMGFYKLNYYKNEVFPRLNETLVNRNCHLYVIRGNHDDPEYFKQTNNPFDFSNITLLEDYSELTLLSKSILLIGGAVSIDRRFRTEGKSWWCDEPFKLKLEHEFPYRDSQYDLVVTHTRPGVCGAFKGFDNIKEWCDQDADLKNDLIEESQLLNYVYERTRPKDWIYGHFHTSNTTQYETTKFRCLDIDEQYGYYYA
jgi:UDP-2,3-diacylglucosamine pyrophosphatase LpxH